MFVLFSGLELTEGSGSRGEYSPSYYARAPWLSDPDTDPWDGVAVAGDWHESRSLDNGRYIWSGGGHHDDEDR